MCSSEDIYKHIYRLYSRTNTQADSHTNTHTHTRERRNITCGLNGCIQLLHTGSRSLCLSWRMRSWSVGRTYPWYSRLLVMSLYKANLNPHGTLHSMVYILSTACHTVFWLFVRCCTNFSHMFSTRLFSKQEKFFSLDITLEESFCVTW